MLEVMFLVVLFSRYLLIDAGGHGEAGVAAGALLDTTSDALDDTASDGLIEV